MFVLVIVAGGGQDSQAATDMRYAAIGAPLRAQVDQALPAMDQFGLALRCLAMSGERLFLHGIELPLPNQLAVAVEVTVRRPGLPPKRLNGTSM